MHYTEEQPEKKPENKLIIVLPDGEVLNLKPRVLDLNGRGVIAILDTWTNCNEPQRFEVVCEICDELVDEGQALACMDPIAKAIEEDRCVACGDTAEPVGVDDMGCCVMCGHDAPLDAFEGPSIHEGQMLLTDTFIQNDERGHPAGVRNHCSRCRAIGRRATGKVWHTDGLKRCLECNTMGAVRASEFRRIRKALYDLNPGEWYALENSQEFRTLCRRERLVRLNDLHKILQGREE